MVKSIGTYNPHCRALWYDNILSKWPRKFLPPLRPRKWPQGFWVPRLHKLSGQLSLEIGHGEGSVAVVERSPRWRGLAHWPLGGLLRYESTQACFGFPNLSFPPPPLSLFSIWFQIQFTVFLFVSMARSFKKDSSIFGIVSCSIFIKTFDKGSAGGFELSSFNTQL